MQAYEEAFGRECVVGFRCDKLVNIRRPDNTDYDPYYEQYVSLVENRDVLDTLAGQPTVLRDLLTAVPEEKGSFAYADGKWSVKEVLGHLIDGERMFAYRLFRIARDDQTPIE